MRQHSSPVDCKDPLTRNQNYLCTTAPCKRRNAQIPRGNAALWPRVQGSTEPRGAEITVRKYNSPEYWEPNLQGFMVWLRFYWSHLYTRAVPLTGTKSSRFVSQHTCLGWFINAQVHPINKGIRMHFSLDAQESASQAGFWLLGRQLCPVVWAEGLWKLPEGQDPNWGRNKEAPPPLQNQCSGTCLNWPWQSLNWPWQSSGVAPFLTNFGAFGWRGHWDAEAAPASVSGLKSWSAAKAQHKLLHD